MIVIPTAGPHTLLDRSLKAAARALEGRKGEVVVACNHLDLTEIREHFRVIDSLNRHDCAVTGVATAVLGGGDSSKAASLNWILQHLDTNLDQHRLDGWACGGERISRPTWLLCVDVDEELNERALDTLSLSGTDGLSPPVLVQAAKFDRRSTSSIFSVAFEALYDSWFYWEANTRVGGPFLGSSYYGSMGRLRVDRLLDGEGPPFDVIAAVEDAPLYVDHLTPTETVLIEEPIAVGLAPPDLPGVLALWGRWTRGNLPLASSLVGTARDHRSDGISALQAWHHAHSWLEPLCYPMLLLATATQLVLSPQRRRTKASLVAASIAFAAQAARQLLPTPRTNAQARACRAALEPWLWLALLPAPVSETNRSPYLTPRTPGPLGARRRRIVIGLVAIYTLGLANPRQSWRARLIWSQILLAPLWGGIAALLEDRPSHLRQPK